MGKDMLKLPNNKKGFLILLVLEALIAVWALAATLYAIRAGMTRRAVYGGVTMFAIFYILGRSLRSYRDIARREKESVAKSSAAGEGEAP